MKLSRIFNASIIYIFFFHFVTHSRVLHKAKLILSIYLSPFKEESSMPIYDSEILKLLFNRLRCIGD